MFSGNRHTTRDRSVIHEEKRPLLLTRDRCSPTFVLHLVVVAIDGVNVVGVDRCRRLLVVVKFSLVSPLAVCLFA